MTIKSKNAAFYPYSRLYDSPPPPKLYALLPHHSLLGSFFSHFSDSGMCPSTVLRAAKLT